MVKYLLTSPKLIEAGHSLADVHANKEEVFRWTCRCGRWDVIRWLVMDYGLEKKSKIEESLEKFPKAQEYFRVKEDMQDMQEIQKARFVSNKNKQTMEGIPEVNDERATKKAKKL